MCVVSVRAQMAATDTVTQAREALSASELDRLVELLGVLPAGRRWAVVHMHGPLLCALGLVGAPDPGYQRAALRRFNDPIDARRRALALLDELDRDARAER